MSYVNGVVSSQLIPGIQESGPSSSSGRVGRADAGTYGVTQPTPSSNGSTITSLSAAAGVLADALSGSDVRMSLVTGLRDSIGAGIYNVAASDVAGKMLNTFLN